MTKKSDRPFYPIFQTFPQTSTLPDDRSRKPQRKAFVPLGLSIA
ncbi:hypothetical protein [Microcoleus sp. LEGE 07076]|nr:hypothetical protein [Microcoleus sp. LEGE 07076]